MAPSYKILVTSIDACGHINASLGFGELLQSRGHTIMFANRQKYKHLADRRGFQFVPFDEEVFAGEKLTPFMTWLERSYDLFHKDAIERFKCFTQKDRESYAEFVDGYIKTNEALERVLKSVEVDLIIGDLLVPFPVMAKSKIPYIPIASLNPLTLFPNGPPAFSGLSVHSGKKEREEFHSAYEYAMAPHKEKINNWLHEHGLPGLYEPAWFLDRPKHFGFYHYPEDLDYTEVGPVLDNWVRVDLSIRQPDNDYFVIPECLKDKPGKLIYFSMGSQFSADLQLMRQLIDILSKSPHRFIVSKGPKGDELELPSNMWGENYVNQLKVLPEVDMVITHGGNNTIMETLYHKKPMIVIPYYFDQLDNAARIVDKNLGRRIDPWNLDEKYFLESIESILNDNELKNRIETISNNMRNTKSRRKAAEMVEKLIEETREVKNTIIPKLSEKHINDDFIPYPSTVEQ
ncbi:uncharacterized UDP-glucosyltransferase YjiC-like [Tetranychus urticae]|uniref:UDP-glycosyltransferase 201D2 n=1 Tax=Tetranychus urticae TaxID=32264 RepID=T1K2A6_TETUR|nr:uncharacterized UDP-glucosyltransferase YjiC-like [Tetranychus urticae]AHX56866.1 UDP-glycosyltransferase 201D2 [Tetranychus urticae]